jgi:hypothetical protein
VTGTRPKTQWAVDLVAFATFVLLTSSGVLLRYVLPPGSGRRTTLWGLDRHAWGALHFWVAMAFFGVLLVHVLLHRRWIATMAGGRPREGSALRLGLGVLAVAALLAAAAAPLLTPVERAELPGRGPASGVRGSATLGEVARAAGVSVAELVAALGLPPDVSPDEPLSALAREHGLRLGEVRRAVQALEARGDR